MLDWTGERYLPYIDPSVCGAEIHYEHLHRYAFASQFVKGKTVLDLASGEGYGSFLIAMHAKQVTGIDIDPASVDHASATYVRDNLEFRLGSITDVPVQGTHIFDVVVCYEAIEHITEQDALLSEVKRLLKPDGIFIVSTPNKALYTDILGNVNPFHKKELEFDEFISLLNKNFAHVRMYGQSTLSGSRIYPLETKEPPARSSEFVVNKDDSAFSFKEDTRKNTLYFIAIAANTPIGLAEPVRSYLVDQSNTEIGLLSVKITELSALRDSLTRTIAAKEQHIAEKDQHALELTRTIAAKDQHALELTRTIAEKDREIYRLNGTVHYLKEENDALKSSISYRLLTKFHRSIIEPCFPPNTKRRELYDLALKGGRIATSEGIKKAFSEYKRYRISRKNQTKDSEIAAAPPAFPAPCTPTQPPLPSESPAPESKRPGDDPVSFIFSQMNIKSPEYVPLSGSPVHLKKDDIRFIAFYLPQFHPIPENDLWWGKGFTEWTNVTRALPQFIGHYQPHRPDELGYYDLRLPEVQKRQVELAKLYGVYGFCFYYYWFGGKKLLKRPLNQYIEHKEFDLPFCICWANENWTRRWDGLDNEILISQAHSAENDIRFIQDVEPVLRDPRYIRISGKPLLIVYRATLLTEPVETVRRWREYCRQCGIGEIYLVAALCFGCTDPTVYGFDAAIEFPPHTMYNYNDITRKKRIINPNFSGRVYDYEEFVHSKKYLYPASFKLFRTVSPGWDNTARRPDHASIFAGATPYLYKEWLLDVSKGTRESHPEDEQIVFINAWNEWAEGTHLEPDQKFGYGYLQATAEVITEMRQGAAGQKKIIVVSHDAHFHGAQLLALHLVKVLKERFHYDVFTIIKVGGVLEKEFEKYSRVFVLEREYPNRPAQEKLLSDLVHKGVKTAIANTVVSGDILELLAKNNIKTISLIHELPGLIGRFGQNDNLEKVSRSAHKIVFPTLFVRDAVKKIAQIPDDICVVAPQGLYEKNKYKNNISEARQLLRKVLSLPENARIVLGVGFADHRKGADIFARVAKDVVSSLHDCYFIWVGHEDQSFTPSVHEFIRKEKLTNQIRFVGKQEDISLFYAGADLYLLTSREDPFPSVVLEALDVEVPVIGFEDAGGFGDLLKKCGGTLIPYLDAPAMGENVIHLLKNENVRAKMGKKGREIIEKEYRFIDYVYSLFEILGQPFKKVSVILPNYNYERYLQKRLQSIVDQDYPVYEILFLDDCSTDNSLGLARKFAQSCPVDFRIIVNANNSGSVFRQWAKGLSMASGDYCWITEADDLSDATFLTSVMAGFEDHGVILSYCQSKQMDENGNIIANDYLQYTNDVDPEKWRSNYIINGEEEIRNALAVKNTIPNVSAVVFRKVDISGILTELTGFKVAGDWFFYVWLLQKGNIAFCSESLNFHRRHSRAVTQSENTERHFDEIVKMQDLVTNNFSVEKNVIEKIRTYRHQVKDYLFRKSGGTSHGT